jgi:hypothetical protein
VNRLGLVRPDGLAPGDLKPGATPLGDGLYLPDDFAISPALIAEVEKFQGGAVAVTSMDKNGPSGGLIVLHPGNSDLLRGVIETAIQVLEPADPIEGFKTYRIRGDVEGWIASTARLFLASPSRDEIAAAIARLNDSALPSLAGQETLRRYSDDRKDALLFVYVDGQRLVEEIGPHLVGRDAAVVRSVLDLDHIESFAAGLRTSGEGVHFQATLNLKEGHHNLAYGLIRTAPVTGRALEHVPQGAAVVALLGLNPHGSGGLEEEADGAAVEYLTGMDIGREIFANVEEVAVYVLSGDETSGEFPNVGAVVTSKDPSKSEALWNQLLSIPAMVDSPSVDAPREIVLSGRTGREYQLPDAPPLVILRVGDDAILAGTKGAVTAAAEQGPITEDETFRPLIDQLTPATSKAVLAHVGRALSIAEGLAKGNEANEIREVKALVSELTVSVVTDEQPTRFGVRFEATGLPNVPEILKAVATRTRKTTLQGTKDARETVATPNKQ